METQEIKAQSPVGKFESLSKEALSLVKDVPVTLQVLLGESVMSLGDVLKFGKGSVIPLKQKVGQPFTLLLHYKPIAEGEVVEAGENLGIKITNVLQNADSKEMGASS
ncbi:MAG: FliM/FliN family flagellar motor switch protein [Deltaproteobacteria bacterium]|nr:FliM/FliN family flagellar motor switch protein [Deltaproteobacteria bacterium]